MSQDTLLAKFAEFEKETQIDEVNRSKEVDYDAHIMALNKVAGDMLGLEDGAYVILKPVYLRKVKIHSLIFNVCVDGKRYSARLRRRISLGLRNPNGDRWKRMLEKAYKIAMNEKPVGLDPKLEKLPYWKSSNRNCLCMTFGIDDSELVINAKGVVKAHGNKEELIKILHILHDRGL
jgi:hypothetical protein